MAIGRISGPLLKANLIRDGVNLAFETDLLYLDVNNARIGINTDSPAYELDVNGDVRSTDLEVLNQFDIGNFTITGNTISSDQNTINFVAAGGEATIYHSRLIVNDIEFDGNTISTTVSNSDLEIIPNGTGILDIKKTTNIDGDLNVTGNISADGNVTIGGNITIGDALTDTITINASIQSDLIPETTATYDLGSVGFRWRDIYSVNINASNLNLATFEIGNLFFFDTTITTTGGNDLVIDPNGSGAVRIGNFEIFSNTITNVVNASITEIAQSGTGYFKIQGTNGFIPPRGNSAQRPTAYAVAGMTRYNTESRALEIWDPVTNNWVSPAGVIGAISETQANDISIAYALTLG
jgi:hypothetical protein